MGRNSGAGKLTMPEWVVADQPDILGLVVRVLYPDDPARDDGRRWTMEGTDRWMLPANGVWHWPAVLRETGHVVAVGFDCQFCDRPMSTNVHDVRHGYCGNCHGQTGTAQGREILATLAKQGTTS